jgi:hypothetical protein
LIFSKKPFLKIFIQGELPARSPMEKWLELADLPPDDVQEPVKKEVKTENILPTVRTTLSFFN